MGNAADAGDAALLRIETRGAVLTVGLNRPAKRNALNDGIILALRDCFSAIPEEIGAVVIHGVGDHFSSGLDLSELTERDATEGLVHSQMWHRVFDRIQYCRVPVIAALKGAVIGGGLELAMACHLRIAADTAKVGQPEINLGLIPGFGGSQRLLRLCGRAATLELCLLGAPIDAARALELGIVNEVVPADALDNRVQDIARQLARSAPLALRGLLDAVHVGGECSLEAGLEYESAQFGLLFATEDMREGTSAFLQRRPPAFQNR